MAWTEPKTWVNQDPLNESNFNTYIRDNQIALRADTEDAKTKLGKTFPAFQSALLVGHAVIGINSAVEATATSFGAWHEDCKLAFTPKTDLVLFGVQFSMSFWHNNSGGRFFSFGLLKGSLNVSLQETAVIGGTLGSSRDIAYHSVDVRSADKLIAYQAPVPVTRNVEVEIWPTVKVQSGVTASLENPSLVILTALDVGAYE